MTSIGILQVKKFEGEEQAYEDSPKNKYFSKNSSNFNRFFPTRSTKNEESPKKIKIKMLGSIIWKEKL